ncbi:MULTISPECIES: putative quinol monooxygenase [unclassified Roseobacter]|uniref:putative quinol monooxygenase n=2 Tax=Roseobacter TaxID=2433 RepID=UPI0018A2C587|nr:MULTISPECIES: antibiotic biosynthesis monooxygenase [unclassified Roseobacter]MDW3181345.1 antibiotic biosynthesis monooxygenase [Roseobacter sp.]
MEDHIEWVLEMTIQDGMYDGVQPLIDEMVAATQANEPGALVYDYHLTEDKTRCTVLERYADNDAALLHLQNFGAHFADRFLAAFAPERFTVYGPSNDALRAALSGFGATFETRVGGFCRM